MTIVLRKGQRLEDVLPKSNKGTDIKRLAAMKYVGVLKTKEDPLEIQKRMRDEWE